MLVHECQPLKDLVYDISDDRFWKQLVPKTQRWGVILDYQKQDEINAL